MIYEKWKINEMNPTIAWITASKEFLSHGGRKRNPEDPLVKEKLLTVQGDQGSWNSLKRQLHRERAPVILREFPRGVVSKRMD